MFGVVSGLRVYVCSQPPALYRCAYTLNVCAEYTDSDGCEYIDSAGALAVLCRSKTGKPFAWTICGLDRRFTSEAAALREIRARFEARRQAKRDAWAAPQP